MRNSSKQTDPVFVRAMSRSGGTLLVTVLDAHPDIAMSYELYPGLLSIDTAAPADVRRLGERVAEFGTLPAFSKTLEDRRLRTFFARLPRGGLDTETAADLLRRHAEDGLGFESAHDRLRFVERCANEKMVREQGRRWGLKCTPHYVDYLGLWPKARFLYMVRDGRDVLASQLNTGSFDTSARDLAHSWVQGILNFRWLLTDPSVHGMEVRYEELVTDFEREVHRICEFLQVPFQSRMLAYYERSLTIYGANHLSLERIKEPVDPSSVGRWRRELSQEQLENFCEIAGPLLEELGYEDVLQC